MVTFDHVSNEEKLLYRRNIGTRSVAKLCTIKQRRKYKIQVRFSRWNRDKLICNRVIWRYYEIALPLLRK